MLPGTSRQILEWKRQERDLKRNRNQQKIRLTLFKNRTVAITKHSRTSRYLSGGKCSDLHIYARMVIINYCIENYHALYKF